MHQLAFEFCYQEEGDIPPSRILSGGDNSPWIELGFPLYTNIKHK